MLAWTLGHRSTSELGVYDRYADIAIDPAEVDRGGALSWDARRDYD